MVKEEGGDFQIWKTDRRRSDRQPGDIKPLCLLVQRCLRSAKRNSPPLSIMNSPKPNCFVCLL